MRERFLLLERSTQHDLQAIEQLYNAIGTPTLTDETDEEELIVLAYRLHNLLPLVPLVPLVHLAPWPLTFPLWDCATFNALTPPTPSAPRHRPAPTPAPVGMRRWLRSVAP